MNSFSNKTNIRSTKSEVIKKVGGNLIENKKENNFNNSNYPLQNKNQNVNYDLAKSELNNCRNTYDEQYFYSNKIYNDTSSTRNNTSNKIKSPRSQSINISTPTSSKTPNIYRNNDDKLSCASFFTFKKKNLEKFSIPESTDSFKTQANSQIVEQSIELLKHLINQDKETISQENDKKNILLFKLIDRVKKYDDKSEHAQEKYKHSLDLYKKKIDILNLKFLKLRNEYNHLNNENIILKTQLKNVKDGIHSNNQNLENNSNSKEKMKLDENEETKSNKLFNYNSHLYSGNHSKKKLVDNEVQTEDYLGNHCNSSDEYKGTSSIINKKNGINQKFLDESDIHKIREQIRKEVTEEITNNFKKKYKEEFLKMKSPSLGSLSDAEESSLDGIFNKFRNQLDEQINETIKSYKNNFIHNFKDLLNTSKGEENNSNEQDKDTNIKENETKNSVDSINDKINDCINLLEKISKIKYEKKKKEEKIINDRNHLIQVLNNVNNDINNIDDMIYNINSNMHQNNIFNFEENYPEELNIINKNFSKSDDEEEDETKSHISFTNAVDNNEQYMDENINNVNKINSLNSVSNVKDINITTEFYQNKELEYNKMNYLMNDERNLVNSTMNNKIDRMHDETINDNYYPDNNMVNEEKDHDNIKNKNININNYDYFHIPQKCVNENKEHIIDNTNNNKIKKNSNDSINGYIEEKIESVKNINDRTINKLRNSISDKKLKKKSISDNFNNNTELWKKSENGIEFFDMINSSNNIKIKEGDLDVIDTNINNENQNTYINLDPNNIPNDNNIYNVNQTIHTHEEDKREEFWLNTYNNNNSNLFNDNADNLNYSLNRNLINTANINNTTTTNNNSNNSYKNVRNNECNMNNYYNNKGNMKFENDEYNSSNYYNNGSSNIVDKNNYNGADIYNYNLTNDYNLNNNENKVYNKNAEKNLVNCSIYSYHPLLNKKDSVHSTDGHNEKQENEHKNYHRMKMMSEQIHPNYNSKFEEYDEIKKKMKNFNYEKENNNKRFPLKKLSESAEELIHFDDTKMNNTIGKKEENNISSFNSYNNNINDTPEIATSKKYNKNYTHDMDHLNKMNTNNNRENNLNKFDLDENIRINNYKNYGFLKKKDSNDSREQEDANNKYNLFYNFNNENNKIHYIKENDNFQIDDSSNIVLSNYFNKNSNLRRVNSTTINTNKNSTNDVHQKNNIKLNTRSEVHYNLSKSQKTRKKNLEDLFS